MNCVHLIWGVHCWLIKHFLKEIDDLRRTILMIAKMHEEVFVTKEAIGHLYRNLCMV